MDSNTGETQLPALELEAVSLRPAWVALRQEAWRFLPAWMFFVYACLLLNTELTNYSPPRTDFASTVVFPLAVFVLFLVVRALKAPDVRRRTGLLVGGVALALGLPLLNLFLHRPSPLSTEVMLRFYELSNFAWAGLLMWHAWKHRPNDLLLFFGVGLVYGALLENGGIVLGFFHEEALQVTMVRPFVAPVATMIGWSVVLLMATFVVRHLRAWLPWLGRSALLSAIAVGTFATMLDLQIDPIATATGCWVWHGSLPGWFHGVPLVNFVAWLCALIPYAYVMFRLQEKLGLDDHTPWSARHLGWGLAAIPGALVLAAVCFASSTLLLEGPQGASWTLLMQFTARVLGS